jgi:hypothetical protein
MKTQENIGVYLRSSAANDLCYSEVKSPQGGWFARQ